MQFIEESLEWKKRRGGELAAFRFFLPNNGKRVAAGGQQQRMRHEKRYCSSSMRHTVGGFFLSSYIGGGFGAVGTPGCEKNGRCGFVPSYVGRSVGWPLKLREGKGGAPHFPRVGQRRKEEKTGRGLGWVSLGREKGRRKEEGGYFLLFLLAGKIS